MKWILFVFEFAVVVCIINILSCSRAASISTCIQGKLVNGQCYPKDCLTPCLPDEVCVEDNCEQIACVGVECPTGQVCVNGNCYPKNCSTECGADEVCVDVVCTQKSCVGVECPSGQVCVNGNCYPKNCDTDCGADEVCVDVVCIHKSCVGVDCPSEQVCANGNCYPKNCSTDCGADEVCVDLNCVHKFCVGLECPADHGCFEGECLLINCLDPVDCDDNNACTNDICGADYQCQYWFATLGETCSDDLFCNGLETCDGLGGCQAGTDPCPGIGCDEPTDLCNNCISDDQCLLCQRCDLGTNECVFQNLGDDLKDECPALECMSGNCDGNSQCGFLGLGTACGDGTTSECTLPDNCDGLGSCLPIHMATDIACTDTAPADCYDSLCDGLGICDQQAEFIDDDNDGYVPESCGGTDCNDADEFIHPGIQEGPMGDPTCSDSVDNDCDGATDDADPYCLSSCPVGLCNSDGWCWENPLPHGNTIDDIFFAANGNAWAVGNEYILYWNGSNWAYQAETIRQDLKDSSLNGIWGTSASNIWAVGRSATILHYDGTDWNIDQQGVETEFYYDIWGTAENDIWIVGKSNSDTTQHVHYNGVTWTDMTNTVPLGLQGIWGDAPNNYWSVGNVGQIVHYNGSTWTQVSSPTSESLYKVWGADSTHIWAVGANGTIVEGDGTNWVLGPNLTSETLRAISGIDASNVWAVGENGTILYYNGIQWDIESTTTSLSLNAVGGTSTENIFALGDYGVTFDRKSDIWSEFSCRLRDKLYINAGWCTETNDLWVAGGNTPTNDKSVFRRVGNDWQDMNPPAASVRFEAIWGSSADDIWIVGRNGTILRWDGSGFSLQLEGSSHVGVWGVSADDVWISNGLNSMLHWNGSNFTYYTVPASLAVDIWGAVSNEFWIVDSVGDAPICSWDGVDWSAVKGLGTRHLYGVFGTTQNDVWAVGGDNSAHVLHYNGTKWSNVNTATSATALYDIWAIAPNDVWMVGNKSVILRYDGNNWTDEFIPYYVSKDIFPCGNDMWVVSGEAILKKAL